MWQELQAALLHDLDFHEGADDKRLAEGKKRHGDYADI